MLRRFRHRTRLAEMTQTGPGAAHRADADHPGGEEGAQSDSVWSGLYPYHWKNRCPLRMVRGGNRRGRPLWISVPIAFGTGYPATSSFCAVIQHYATSTMKTKVLAVMGAIH